MKDCTTCKYGFVDERLEFPTCHHPLRFSEECVAFNMHEEKEKPERVPSIAEKKLPGGLEEAANRWGLENQEGFCTQSIKVAAFIAGAEWMKKRDDLETADLLAIAHLQGMEQQKATMLEDAVEGIAHPDDCEIWVNLVGYGYKFKDGDKVRVIVIKEGEK